MVDRQPIDEALAGIRKGLESLGFRTLDLSSDPQEVGAIGFKLDMVGRFSVVVANTGDHGPVATVTLRQTDELALQVSAVVPE